jgi:GGDEF domain-containing protein
VLVETGPSVGALAVSRGVRGEFAEHPADERFALGHDRTLWIHLRVQRSEDAPNDWVLNIPIPYLDSVEFFAPDIRGNLTAQQAGDTLALSKWTTPFIYPEFQIHLRDTRPVSLFLKVNNYRDSALPIRLASVAEREQQHVQELVLCGAVIGTLLLLVCWCSLRYWESHDGAEGWYIVYTGLLVLVTAQALGLGNLWLWPYTPGWADSASVVLPLMGVGASTLFLRHVCAPKVRHPLLDQVMLWTGFCCVPLIMQEWLMDRSTAAYLHGVYFALGPLLAVWATVRIWRDGSALGPTLFIAYAPQGLAVLYMAAQMLHLIPVAWQSRYYMVLAVALSVPLLLHALTVRSRQRLDASGRARAASTQDALTGLLVRDRFHSQVRQAIHRAAHDRTPGAIVLIEVANYDHIYKHLGLTVAEQCLLRAVVKLHRVLRDVDPAGRVDIARFGVILDGVSSRDALNERMVGLIASGLIPLPGLHPEVTLHFHMAAVVLDEVHPNPDTVLDELGDILGTIAPRSRRPIRFMDATTTLPAPLDRDSDYDHASDSTPNDLQTPAQPGPVRQRPLQPMPTTQPQASAATPDANLPTKGVAFADTEPHAAHKAR